MNPHGKGLTTMVKRSQVIDNDVQDDDVPEVDPEFRRTQLARQAQANLPELTHRVMSTSELHSITSMDEAISLFQSVSGQDVVEAREEIGDGFDFLENKEALVGRPLFLLQWQCNYSPSYTDADGNALKTVQAWVITQRHNGELAKYRVADFSTGLCAQLWDYTQRTGRVGGLRAPKGLRKSEFPYVDASGQRTVATTYYLDTSREL